MALITAEDLDDAAEKAVKALSSSWVSLQLHFSDANFFWAGGICLSPFSNQKGNLWIVAALVQISPFGDAMFRVMKEMPWQCHDLFRVMRYRRELNNFVFAWGTPTIRYLLVAASVLCRDKPWELLQKPHGTALKIELLVHSFFVQKERLPLIFKPFWTVMVSRTSSALTPCFAFSFLLALHSALSLRAIREEWEETGCRARLPLKQFSFRLPPPCLMPIEGFDQKSLTVSGSKNGSGERIQSMQNKQWDLRYQNPIRIFLALLFLDTAVSLNESHDQSRSRQGKLTQHSGLLFNISLPEASPEGFFFCPPQIERNLHSFPIEPLMHLMNLRRMELVRLSCPSNWLTEQLYDLDDFRTQWPIRSMNIGGFRVGCVCLRQLTSPSWWGIFLDQWESPSRIEIGRSIERWIAV